MRVYPVLCASALNNVGSVLILNFVVDNFPAASERTQRRTFPSASRALKARALPSADSTGGPGVTESSQYVVPSGAGIAARTTGCGARGRRSTAPSAAARAAAIAHER